MRFKNAVAAATGLASAYRPGLRALREVDRNRVKCRHTRKLTGSIDLDLSLRFSHPHDPRWDYGVGVAVTNDADRAIWIEVHPASSHHIDEVLKKHEWLKGWLDSSGTLLNEIDADFVWISSGKMSIAPNSPLRRKLNARGIRLVGQRFLIY